MRSFQGVLYVSYLHHSKYIPQLIFQTNIGYRLAGIRTSPLSILSIYYTYIAIITQRGLGLEGRSATTGAVYPRVLVDPHKHRLLAVAVLIKIGLKTTACWREYNANEVLWGVVPPMVVWVRSERN